MLLLAAACAGVPTGAPPSVDAGQAAQAASFVAPDGAGGAATPDQPNRFLTSDHTKAIVVDGERALVGGMNIGYP